MQQFAKWTDEFGPNQWRLVWRVKDFYTDYLGACALYEDAYFEFFQTHPGVLKELVSVASEVYDDRPSNIDAGFDYRSQETERTHIQDIAIRRSLVRHGVWFKGKRPIRIRQEKGFHPLSVTLSPGNVPFHRPELIEKPQLVGWWKSDSVEAFYQSGRYLQVTDAALEMVRRGRPKGIIAPREQVRALLVKGSYEALVIPLQFNPGLSLVTVKDSVALEEYNQVYLLLCEQYPLSKYRIWCCYAVRKPEKGFKRKNLQLLWSVSDLEHLKCDKIVLPEIPGAIEDFRDKIAVHI